MLQPGQLKVCDKHSLPSSNARTFTLYVGVVCAGEHLKSTAAGTPTIARLSQTVRRLSIRPQISTTPGALTSPLRTPDGHAAGRILQGNADCPSLGRRSSIVRSESKGPRPSMKSSLQLGDPAFSPMASFSTTNQRVFAKKQPAALDEPAKPMVRYLSNTPHAASTRATLSHDFIGGEPLDNHQLSPRSAK